MAESNQRKRWLWAIAALLAVALTATAAYFILVRDSKPKTELVAVPVMKDLNQAGARNALEAAGLKMNIGTEVADDKIPVGIFVTSDPAPGKEVTKGSVVNVSFSSGPGEIQVPDITGQPQARAIKMIENAGLTVSFVKPEDTPRVKADVVTKTNPAAGAKVAKVTKIEITVASGYVSVPDLKGKKLEEATKIIKDNLGLSLATSQQESGDFDPGTVLEQDRSGRVEVGTTISLKIAKEAPAVILPTPPKPHPSLKPQPTDSPTGDRIPTPKPTRNR